MTARCETDQGDRLKAAMESLRDFLNECSLKFTKDGIEMIGQDRARVVAIRYVLPASKIRETGGRYECSEAKGIEVGIKTKTVANCLKCSAAGDVVSIGVDPSARDKLVITCRNSSKVSRWEVVTPSVVDDGLKAETLESLEFSGSVSMASNLFHDMVRDLATAETATVRLYCDGKRLVLSSDGPMAKMTFELGGTDSVFLDSPGKRSADAWPVDEEFPLAFLLKISKAKGLCSRITIRLRPNFPAAITYDSPIGSLTYLLAPRSSSDEPRAPPPPPQAIVPLDARPKKRQRVDSPPPVVPEEEEEEEEEEEDM